MTILPVFNGHFPLRSAENNTVTGDRYDEIRQAFREERVIFLYEMRKKRWISFLFSCLLAFSLASPAWAAEKERTLIPLGKAVGIKLFSDGALVVSLEGNGTLRVGDLLLRVNDTRIQSTEQLQSLLQENGSVPVSMQVRRGERLMTFTDTPRCGSDGVYRLGAWIRDSMAGVGTLKAVKRGQRGDPGELKGDFTVQRDVGTLTANTSGGIFGKMSDSDFIGAAKAIPVARADEVTCGPATILATVSGSETKEYQVEILRRYDGSRDTRDLMLKVTDPQLLAVTGGIVQGM